MSSLSLIIFSFFIPSVTLPYYNGGVQLERNAVYTKLYSKVGLVVMWNGEDAVMVSFYENQNVT